MYLINGIFFQTLTDHISLGRNEHGEPEVMVSSPEISSMFLGTIFMDPANPKEYTGEMIDSFGTSNLFDIEITLESLKFSKRYKGRTEFIEYQFERRVNEEICFGEYSGLGVGNDKANCVIQEVLKDFFHPKEE